MAFRQVGKKDPPGSPKTLPVPQESLSAQRLTQDVKTLKSAGQGRPTPGPRLGRPARPPLGACRVPFPPPPLSFFFSFKKHMSLAITHVLIIIMTRCLMACNKTTTNLALLANLSPLPPPCGQLACPSATPDSFSWRD